MNKYRDHVWLIPEDDANSQLAVGFLDHHAVASAKVGLREPAGGWGKVLEVFESEYLPLLHKYQYSHVVMLIDFDEHEDRKVQCEQRIPADVKPRVFVIGARKDPETLRRELGMGWESIGRELAQECQKDDFKLWRHPHLSHNSNELERMVPVLKPFLFQQTS